LSFKSFLFSTSRNHVLNIIKRASKENEIHDEIIANISMDEHHLVEDELNLKEARELLNAAVNSLPPKRKEVFQLSREEGLSHTEIAQQLGITKGTVNVQIVKALNSIRQYLSENGYQSLMIVLSLLIFS
jgi:RNA polymerase sigma factor (sigma-70 family)